MLKRLFVLDAFICPAREEVDSFGAWVEAGNDSYHRFYLDPTHEHAKRFPNLYQWVLTELFHTGEAVPCGYVLLHFDW